ncbi:hypothetical protein, partial [Shewanella sp. TB4-MNA-CIBAN-0142]|uniref:hypothetical protein n=1 Tax=Shewanella sp. TB4-MNA-CIBAN-0142 TaxID=3140464 RepID=UPI00332E9B7C
RRGASPTPDQEETNGCSLLEHPAAPQHFRYLQNNSCEKSPWGLIQRLTSSLTVFGLIRKC